MNNIHTYEGYWLIGFGIIFIMGGVFMCILGKHLL